MLDLRGGLMQVLAVREEEGYWVMAHWFLWEQGSVGQSAAPKNSGWVQGHALPQMVEGCWIEVQDHWELEYWVPKEMWEHLADSWEWVHLKGERSVVSLN
jgi:hypothetical protein